MLSNLSNIPSKIATPKNLWTTRKPQKNHSKKSSSRIARTIKFASDIYCKNSIINLFVVNNRKNPFDA